MKGFLINVDRCNGCYCCQVACKDEFCEQSWVPYAEAQPLTGQFWLKIEEKERGKVPWTRVTYVPHIGAQTAALREYAPEVLADRDDGIIVIDPEKAKGRKDVADAFEGVYWNEELQIPQGCNGCAHLLDNGWKIPRCVDACPTKGLQYMEIEDMPAEAMQLPGDADQASRVYYLNLPKRFVAGSFYDADIEEVIIGADVELVDSEGNVVAAVKTNDFGDFKFSQVEPLAYTVSVKAEGYKAATFEADATEVDPCIGDIALEK